MNGDPKIRRTKIVATLGPATANASTIGALLHAGTNVVRINASHGTPELRAEWIAAARRAAESLATPVAVLLDLQGPRIRAGDLPHPRELTPGQQVVFAPEEVAHGDELPTTYDGLATDARVGSRILLNDGLLSVEVTGVDAPRVRGRVIDGGMLTAHKGMNLPGLHVSAPALTEKDREDVQDAVRAGVDYLALSFVRRAEDIEELRGLVPNTIKLVAKIEKATALENLERIVAAADAVMVARGDLGVELPFEQVPHVQKRLISEANQQGKPVITATQMLESMVHAPRPTRAEASDVANAILDGTDAVMLSAETAVGQYPLEAVRAMDRIIREMERHPLRQREERRKTADGVTTEDAIAWGTFAVARMLKTPLIVTHQGRVHRAQSRRAPAAGADSGGDDRVDDVSPARARVGRRSRPRRPRAGVRRHVGGGARSHSQTPARQAGRLHRDDGGSTVGRFGQHQPHQGREGVMCG